MALAQLAEARVKRCALSAARPEVVQIFQKPDGLVVVGGALRLNEGIDPLPQFWLAPGKAVEVPGSRGRLFTLAAGALLPGALRCCAASRLGAFLGGHEELLNSSAAGHVAACPNTP